MIRLKDIAEKAGVSTATVTYVLNNKLMTLVGHTFELSYE
jgi:DNA-binding LacI/PurR family transcriptional regulator